MAVSASTTQTSPAPACPQTFVDKKDASLKWLVTGENQLVELMKFPGEDKSDEKLLMTVKMQKDMETQLNILSELITESERLLGGEIGDLLRHVVRISSRRGPTWRGPKVTPTKNKKKTPRSWPTIFRFRANSLFYFLIFIIKFHFIFPFGGGGGGMAQLAPSPLGYVPGSHHGVAFVIGSTMLRTGF